MRDRIIDIVVWILIAVFGLVTAYVTFGILTSQASTEIQGYSVEGALAGFIVSAGVLTSLYLQVRKSSGELQDLQKHNRELQDKLLRGAPRPLGFDTEVAERERIVLARPGEWRPTGGIIFDYRLPLEKLQKDDQLPAQFRLMYAPIEEDSSKTRKRSSDPNADQMQYYKDLQEEVKKGESYEAYWASYSAEYVMLGDQAQPIKSLKFISREYVRIEVTQSTEGKKEINWWGITKDEYEARNKTPAQKMQTESDKEGESAPTQSEHEFAKEIWHVWVVCYCKPLKTTFFFHFFDDLDGFVASSDQFNQILGSVRFLT